MLFVVDSADVTRLAEAGEVGLLLVVAWRSGRKFRGARAHTKHTATPLTDTHMQKHRPVHTNINTHTPFPSLAHSNARNFCAHARTHAHTHTHTHTHTHIHTHT